MMLARIALSFAVTGAAVIPLLSQTSAEEKPSFEVASIKANNSHSPTDSTSYGTHFIATNVKLKELILNAYHVLDFQLVGGPDWINSNTVRFDIEATTDSIRTHDSEVIMAMVRSLLEDRFQLKVHRENRELSVFNLIAGKRGHKLQPTVEGRPGPDGLGPGSSHNGGSPRGIELSASGATIDHLIDMLASRIGRPIIDKTDLTGKYDFALKFAPYNINAPPPADPVGPDVFTAIQEQLGLKLEAGKGSVQVLVIDNVQKPTVN
jgi:uncharacterized protein (TIGR03435 family)